MILDISHTKILLHSLEQIGDLKMTDLFCGGGACTQHVKGPGPGIEPEPPQQ